MNTVLRILLFLACFSTELRAENIEINERSVFQLRSTLKLLTPTPHIVSPKLWELCSVIGKAEGIAHEKERAGPHANLAVNLYASPGAVAAMASSARQFPAGTIIVKEKLTLDGAVNAVTGMVKRPAGFDQENGDWEYFYSDKLSGFTTGRIASCAQCHAKAKSADYVYTVK